MLRLICPALLIASLLSCSASPSPAHATRKSPAANDNTQNQNDDIVKDDPIVTTPITPKPNAPSDPIPDPTGDDEPEIPSPKEPPPVPLKVLSLNVWTGEPVGLARDIKQSGADIACLQEVSPAEAKAGVDALGKEWNLVHTGDPGTGYAIASKVPLIKRLGETSSTRGGIGALYQLPSGVRTIVYCHHANAYPYGPYKLGVEKLPVAEVIAGEKTHRGAQMEELLRLVEKSLGGIESVILVGDFNAPSHLDYNPPMPWPISTSVHALGFRDSYADVHPNNAKKTACQFAQNDPGITWARLGEEEEYACFDRIDFIYYASDAARPVESKTLDLLVSDHRAVLTSFEIATKPLGPKAGKPTPSDGREKVWRRPALAWSKVDTAVRYDVYLDVDPSPKGKPTSTAETLLIPSLLKPNTKYFWRVDAVDTLGKVSTGDVWSFQTQDGLGLVLDKLSFKPGETITIEFDGAQDPKDWIGIMAYGTAGAKSWKYLNDSGTSPSAVVKSGRVSLIAPAEAGSYSIRAMLSNYYNDVDDIVIEVK